MELNQYQIVLVNLNPTDGSEINKTRPCIILSPDVMTRNLQTIVVAPLTTIERNYPTRVEINHHGKKGYIILDQIRTVDKTRIVKVFEKAEDTVIKEVKSVLFEAYIR